MSETVPRLRSLELQGYKTFASKVVFEFAPTITCIVGPNGSGKSNIADAIRWVLGEQSYSLLRGKRTEDMIFSGSETRPRASMASASIIFDNTDGWLPIDFSEVSIGRRAYRDGVNEYVLNGQRVRLRDVTELLARCGLGQRTYTIIGQGLVDAALSLKAEERRNLFEEAAGISLYRARKEEALRRLDATRRNIERVQDILAELRPRLRSLERQARRAEAYESVRQDLRAALREWYGYHWYRSRDTLQAVEEEVAQVARERETLRERQRMAEARAADLRAQVVATRGRIAELQGELSQLARQREDLGRQVAVAEERLTWLEGQRERDAQAIRGLKGERRELAGRVEGARQELERRERRRALARQSLASQQGESGGKQAFAAPSNQVGKALQDMINALAQRQSAAREARSRLERIEDDLQEASAALSRAQEEAARAEGLARKAQEAEQAARQDLRASGHALADLEEALGKTRQQLMEAERELAKWLAQRADLEARQAVLREAEQRAEANAQAITAAIQEMRVQGFLGHLRHHLRVREGMEQAIFAALGDFHRAVVLEDFNHIERALAYLVRMPEARGLGLVPAQGEAAEKIAPPEDPDCLGNALDMVSAPEPFLPALRLLLARTLLVRDDAAAVRLLPSLPPDGRLVTLDGHLYHAQRTVLLGRETEVGLQAAEKARLKQRLERAVECHEQATLEAARLREELAELERQRKAAESTQRGAREAADQARRRLESARAALEAQQARLSQLQARQEALQAELERERAALASLEREGADAQAAQQRLEMQLNELLAQAQDVGAGPQAALRARERLSVAEREVEDARLYLQDLQSRMGALEADLARRTARLGQTEAQIQEHRERLDAGLMELEEVRAKVREVEAQLAPLQEALGQAEKARNDLEREVGDLRVRLETVDRRYAQLQVSFARKQEEVASMRRRIEDDFGLVAFEPGQDPFAQEPLPIEGLVEHLPRRQELAPETEARVRQLRAQIRRMGAVNPEVRHEFKQVQERVEFLTSQLQDLEQAEEQIREVIGELDLLMEREFRTTFDAVAAEFREMFTRLFGGGSARLTLTDSEDLTSTGIDIEARLPGRREQGLAMLSGGERSLTAAALIFALLKVSPTPFCVLDEVDAMLDEANVVRFREVLQELSRETQFIIITHNRATVQAAEVVYGVSMGPDSASRVISLKMDEAEKALAG
jgi:chromosome segregation protein